MRKTILFVLSIFVVSCSSSNDPKPPTDTIDELTGTTWIRYGFKSPVNGKDVYYYLTFKKNLGIDSYIKYNKTELSPNENRTGTYKDVTKSNSLGIRSLVITLDNMDSSADIHVGKLTYHAKSGDLIYTKE